VYAKFIIQTGWSSQNQEGRSGSHFGQAGSKSSCMVGHLFTEIG